MKKRTFFHIATGFVATVCFLAAGLSLNFGQQVIDFAASQTPEVALAQPPAVDIFDFGDNKNHQILLALANTPSQNYTLTAVSLDDPLTPRPIAVCTHTGVPVVSPPASLVDTTNKLAVPTVWQRLAAWLSSPAADGYFVALWSPNDQADAYVLVSSDGPTAPVVCAAPVDEGV